MGTCKASSRARFFVCEKRGQTPPPWGSVKGCQLAKWWHSSRIRERAGSAPPFWDSETGAGFAILRYVSISRMCRSASSYFVPFRTTIPQVTRFWLAVLPGSGVGFVACPDAAVDQAGSRNTRRTALWRLCNGSYANGLGIPRNHGWY